MVWVWVILCTADISRTEAWLVVLDNILVLLEVVSATSARAAVWEQESSHCPAALMAAPVMPRAVHNIRRPSIKILVL